jgi:hypothetical protein
MSRLPQPGLDSGTWGDILNDYLSVVHGSNGSLKAGIVQEAHLDAAVRTKLNTAAGVPDDGSITEAKLSTQVQTKLNATSGVASVNSQTGAVTLTKADVGLGNVDNTSDANKPVSTATQTALSGKANLVHQHIVGDVTGLQAALDAKATTAHQHAIADVTSLQAALDAKAASSSLAVVATTGSYADLLNKPVIPQSLSTTDELTEGTTNLYFTAARAASAAPVQTVAGQTGAVTLAKADVGLGNVDNTSDANKPVSAATQTALTGKAPSVHTHTVSDISDSTVTGRSVVTATDAAGARAAIGAGISNLVIGTTAGTAKAGDYTPTQADVGLGNVDNTSDANKPVSTATQTALTGKAPSVHTHTAADISDATATGRSVIKAADAAAARTAIGAGTSSLVIGTTAGTAKAGDYVPVKADVGLGNVDNTSDANKPVSTATQTALNLKADTATLGAKVLLIDNAAALPAGTPAGVIVVVKS